MIPLLSETKYIKHGSPAAAAAPLAIVWADDKYILLMEDPRLSLQVEYQEYHERNRIAFLSKHGIELKPRNLNSFIQITIMTNTIGNPVNGIGMKS